MPSQEEHLAKERASAEAERLLRDADLLDWATTAAFYRAVHLVEAYFARLGTHHETHVRRTDAVGQHLSAIHAQYGLLLRLSRRARYGPPDAVSPAEHDIARELLAQIESALRPRL